MRNLAAAVMALLAGSTFHATYGQCSPPDVTDAVLCVNNMVGSASSAAAQFAATGVSPFWATFGAGTDSIFMQPSTNCVTGACNFVGGATDASVVVKAACTDQGLYIYCAVQDNSFVNWNGTDYGDDSVDMYLDGQSSSSVFATYCGDWVPCHGPVVSECTYHIQVFMGATTPPTSCRFGYYDPISWTWLQNNTITFAQAQTQFGFQVKITTVDATHKTQEWYLPWDHIGDQLCAFTEGEDLSNKLLAFCAGYNDQDPTDSVGTPKKLRWPLPGDPSMTDQNYFGNLSVPTGVVVEDSPCGMSEACMPPAVLPRAVRARAPVVAVLSDEYFTIQGQRLGEQSKPRAAAGSLVLRRTVFADGSHVSTLAHVGM